MPFRLGAISSTRVTASDVAPGSICTMSPAAEITLSLIKTPSDTSEGTCSEAVKYMA